MADSAGPASDAGDDGDAPDAFVYLRDAVTVVAIVAVVAALLFAISGVWPPFVAVESGSMEPDMERGDMIFIVDTERYAGDSAVGDTGIVTLEASQDGGHETYGKPGDVVVFAPDGDRTTTPIIHRAHFWVEEGESWVETSADETKLAGHDCEDLSSCPAPHDGFVTKGDANDDYDQLEKSTVVAPEWIDGKASIRIPMLGYVRLLFESAVGLIGS